MKPKLPRRLADLAPDPANPRAIEAANAAGLQRSLEEFGDLGGIVFNVTTGQLVAGHQRVADLQRARAELAVVDGRGYILHPKTRERFAVRFVEWDADKAARALVAANNPHLQGRWTDAAAPLVERLKRIDLQLAKDLRIDTLLRGLPKPPRVQSIDDAVPPPPDKPYSRAGDVWLLGRHRVACVDSLAPETRDLLLGGRPVHAMACDPPYAIYGSSTGVSSEVTDDKIVRPFFEKLLDLAGAVLPWFGHAYVCCDWRTWPAIWEAAKRTPMVGRNLIVWDKGGQGLGSNYANTYELIGFFAKIPPETATGQRRAAGVRIVNRPNLQRFDRPRGDDRQHNAAKPLGLFEEFVTNSTDDGQTVLDPFMGSGTTVLACERAAAPASAPTSSRGGST